MARFIEIGGRRIGAGEPPYVIAELSGNHNGELWRAMRLLEAAHAAGADAVKLQTYTADTITIDHDGPDFRIEGGLWDGRVLYELYQEAHTPWDWHGPLFERARELGVVLFSSPFDETAVDFLVSLGAPALKIASFELVDLPLIEHAARSGLPLVMSTGMASPAEIGEAVDVARGHGCRDLMLLHCVSGYPTPAQESRVTTVAELARRFDVPVGLSDHTLGTAVAVAAVALGAAAVEKHVTLSRQEGGVDSAFSLEPAELARLVRECREAFDALGRPDFACSRSEAPNLKFRRSLYVVKDMEAGERFDRGNIRVIRPGFGLAPRELPRVLGRPAAFALRRGTALTGAAVQGWDGGRADG